MKNRIYLITGAAGFLGSHVCEELLERGERVRALVLNGDKSVKYVPKAVEIVTGDLCDVESLDNFFTVDGDTETVVIHCASMVTVDPAYNQKLMDVNVVVKYTEQSLNNKAFGLFYFLNNCRIML